VHNLFLLNANRALIEKIRLGVTLPESWSAAADRVDKNNAAKIRKLGGCGQILEIPSEAGWLSVRNVE
jgi:hypothetical protein